MRLHRLKISESSERRELVSKQLTHSSDIQRFEIKAPRVRETKLFLNGAPGIQEPPDTLECGLSLKPET